MPFREVSAVKNIVVRMLVCVSLLIVGIMGTACSSAQEQEFAGQQSHERHATGMDSQAGDL